MIIDPISDMLTRIRNAQAVRKAEIVLPFSVMKFHIGKILEQEGFVEKVEEIEEEKMHFLRLVLKYDHRKPVIRLLKRVSKPGRRVYTKATDLPRIMSDMGIAIISTPNGLMTNKDARVRKLGGENICEVA